MKRTRLQRKTPLRAKSPRVGSTPSQRAARIVRAAIGRKRRRVTAEERSARAIVGRRSAGVCEGCGVRPATDWAHRVGRGQQGGWSPVNGLHLCSDLAAPDGLRGCHEWSHSRRAHAEDLGWIVPSTADPATVPVWHARFGWVLLLEDGDVVKAGEVAA